jgi:signal peptidase I
MTSPDSPAPLRAPWRDLLDLILTIGGGLLLALAFRTLAYQPFTIPSASMEPGLQVGDYIVVSKFAYGWSGASLPLGRAEGAGRLLARAPRRGDVVVFRLPRNPREALIKRVIGLPGDRVRLADGVVYLNGSAVPAAAVGQAAGAMSLQEVLPGGPAYITLDRGPGRPGDDTAEVVVPAGRYLVLGDNRDNSLDSRWPAETGVGLLPAENLIGRADLILASWRPGAALWRPWTWLNLRAGRFLKPVR